MFSWLINLQWFPQSSLGSLLYLWFPPGTSTTARVTLLLYPFQLENSGTRDPPFLLVREPPLSLSFFLAPFFFLMKFTNSKVLCMSSNTENSPLWITKIVKGRILAKNINHELGTRRVPEQRAFTVLSKKHLSLQCVGEALQWMKRKDLHPGGRSQLGLLGINFVCQTDFWRRL